MGRKKKEEENIKYVTGAMVKKVLKERKWSQAELAEAIGVTRGYVNKILFNDEPLSNVAFIYNVSVALKHDFFKNFSDALSREHQIHNDELYNRLHATTVEAHNFEARYDAERERCQAYMDMNEIMKENNNMQKEKIKELQKRILVLKDMVDRK